MDNNIDAGIGNLVINDPVLAKYAVKIRRLGKRVLEDFIEIGWYLHQAQEHAGHGTWLAWIEAEFSWSDQTARRFIHLYEFDRDSKFNNLLNLDLPLSALYQLAAPKTPDAARKEIAERVEAGGEVSVAEVTEIIAKAKGEALRLKAELETDLQRLSREADAKTDIDGDEDPGTAQHRAAMAQIADTEDAPGAGDNSTAKQERTRPATAPGDEALLGFTACVLELMRRIDKHGPLRFAKTSVAGSDLAWLSEFLEALAEYKGFEPAPKRKADIPNKPFKHTLNLKAHSARNGRDHHSRQ
jgi:hypothetical protein